MIGRSSPLRGATSTVRVEMAVKLWASILIENAYQRDQEQMDLSDVRHIHVRLLFITITARPPTAVRRRLSSISTRGPTKRQNPFKHLFLGIRSPCLLNQALASLD